jgi:hypothetical protein
MNITDLELKKIRESKYYSKMFRNLNDNDVKKIVKKWLKDIDKLNIKNINWNLKKVLIS